MLRAPPNVALALVVLAPLVLANLDCDKAYQGFRQQLDRGKAGNMSRERAANLERWAQRAYNACQTGDVENPKALFERLDRDSY